MALKNHFTATGRVAGGFMTPTGAVITLATKSGKDAFIHITTTEKTVPANGTRLEVEGYVTRRRGYDRKGQEYHAQSFRALKITPEKTSAQKAFDADSKGRYYDDPHFKYEISGTVERIVGDEYKTLLVNTLKPNGRPIGVWLSMKTPKRGCNLKVGDMAEFTTDVYTADRKHETLTVRDFIKDESAGSDDSHAKRARGDNKERGRKNENAKDKELNSNSSSEDEAVAKTEKEDETSRGMVL